MKFAKRAARRKACACYGSTPKILSPLPWSSRKKTKKRRSSCDSLHGTIGSADLCIPQEIVDGRKAAASRRTPKPSLRYTTGHENHTKSFSVSPRTVRRSVRAGSRAGPRKIRYKEELPGVRRYVHHQDREQGHLCFSVRCKFRQAHADWRRSRGDAGS